jgi:hypothetical protein
MKEWTTKLKMHWKVQLKKKKILFLDQIIEHDKEYLLKWQHFCEERGIINYGDGEPLWYKRLKQIVSVDESSREIKDRYMAKEKSIEFLKVDDVVSRKKR